MANFSKLTSSPPALQTSFSYAMVKFQLGIYCSSQITVGDGRIAIGGISDLQCGILISLRSKMIICCLKCQVRHAPVYSLKLDELCQKLKLKVCLDLVLLIDD